MDTELLNLVQRFAGVPVLLVGDFMLDRYVFGEVERISQEAPVPVLRAIEREDRLGGAGFVALNVLALRGYVRCCGLLGEDQAAKTVVRELQDAGANTEGLVRSADRPTIIKTRFVGLADHRHQQQVLRVDEERTDPLQKTDEQSLLEAVTKLLPGTRIVCLQDYGKGVVSTDLCVAVIRCARDRGLPVCIDPARREDWAKYNGATLATPNRAELEAAAGRKLRDDELSRVAREICGRYGLDSLLVTLGRAGSLLASRDKEPLLFPTVARTVYDNTGAGDVVLAMVALALAAGGAPEQAAELANIAGGLEVEKFGCVPVEWEEIIGELKTTERRSRGKLRTRNELKAELGARRAFGEPIVFTNGCFDILHPGHIELLAQAKKKGGGVLVVAINSDKSVRELKGAGRPIRNELARAQILAALETVDYVTVFDEPTPLRLIEELVPDVLVKGSDWANKGVIGREIVESRGGRVELIDLVEGYSTTAELERIRAAGAATTREGR